MILRYFFVQSTIAFLFCNSPLLLAVKRIVPHRKMWYTVLAASAAVKVLSAPKVVMLLSGKRREDVKPLLLVLPVRKRERGGCIMKLEEILQLFVVIGGTVGITFQIAWAIFKEIHNNKK